MADEPVSDEPTSSASAGQSPVVLPDFFSGTPDQRWLDWIEDFELHAEING
jgi:hypothetical protein